MSVVFSWDDSRRAFTDAAEWFVETTSLVGDRWNRPGLGQWDIRALVGHTSRSLLTVETYLARPAEAVEVPTAADYFRVTRTLAAGLAVTARGRDAGTALGADPAAPPPLAENRRPKRLPNALACADGGGHHSRSEALITTSRLSASERRPTHHECRVSLVASGPRRGPSTFSHSLYMDP